MNHQVGQYIETFVCVIASSATYELKMKTQMDRKRVKRIQIFTIGISDTAFLAGRSTLKAANNQTPYFSEVANDLLLAYSYQKSEERGLSLDYTEVPAEGLDLVLTGSFTSASGTLYVTLFYE